MYCRFFEFLIEHKHKNGMQELEEMDINNSNLHSKKVSFQWIWTWNQKDSNIDSIGYWFAQLLDFCRSSTSAL